MTKENLPSDEEDSTEASDEELTSEQAADEVPKEDDPNDNYLKLLEKEKDRIDAEMGAAKIIAVGAGLLGIGPIVYAVQIHLQTPDDFNLAELGTFVGGTSGPLWSLAALAALYLGFLAQRRDSEQQQEAFEKQQKAQTERFEREQFENTFFRLLDVYEKVSQPLTLDNAAGAPSILRIMEDKIKNAAIRFKARKYLGHDNFVPSYSASNTNVISSIKPENGDQLSPTEVEGVELDEEEKSSIVEDATEWLFNESWNDVKDFLNVLVLIIDLFERTDEDQVPVDRYHMLLESRMEEREKRIIYWITYCDVDNEIVDKLRKYKLSNIEMPSDFNSLDKSYM
ncbi:hypothetical protein [Salinibacter ruber]|uniref:hypothetical protein n=1 Tax=Salinibacter ruber TaxID=146919 RepID=UPI00216834BB|nr:hypothetical protein [Salinibacter ruber]MCS3698089.1 hypothetical protein [Salinibacter ruber]